MVIGDLIVLGRACPEPLRDGRVTVCLAGWSETMGFVRIYPTRPDMPWRNWDIVKVEVEKTNTDNRLESWKIRGSRAEWDQLAAYVEIVGHVEDKDYRHSLIANLVDDGIHTLNEQQRSLGIIKPQIIKTYFARSKKYGQMWQMGLPGLTDLDAYQVKRSFPQEPRIRFTYPGCQTQSGEHDFQVLEWGFYEWLRKNPDNKEQVWDNALINRKDASIYFLVGNQAAHRTSFMIISVLRFTSGSISLPLFPYRKLPD